MKLPRFFRRLIIDFRPGDQPDRSGRRHRVSLRNAVVWIFITLVALFLTEQHSLFDGPVPLPPELGLEPPPAQ
ncbi:hypothetical protein [Massilia sp. SYSU DXS3249]